MGFGGDVHCEATSICMYCLFILLNFYCISSKGVGVIHRVPAITSIFKELKFIDAFHPCSQF